MESITTIAKTNAVTSITACTLRTDSTAAFAMSSRGYTFAAPVAGQFAAQRWIDATDLTIDLSGSVRERNVSAKGHVGFAHTPGIPAWSPPLC